ncbi:MAG: cation transporter [Nanoarchaeota archaeon]|nr:cation transporter [Nanoarchaeota archaeon]
MNKEKKASWLGIIGNILLFLAKIIVGYIYNSIAIISDALNSFTDIIASLIVYISVIMSHEKADKEHQFGHTRAQPIAGLIVAIFIGIVGFQVIIVSITRILEGGVTKKGIIPIILVAAVMIIKFLMYVYTRDVCKKTKSTALLASAVDHRNDVIISFTVLIGVTASNLGYAVLEPMIAIIIGLWIIKSGFDVGRGNIRYLIGEAPSDELMEKVEKTAKSVKGVIGLNDIRAHYVGTSIEAEVHIYVDKKMNISRAHEIGKKVQKKLEAMDEISHAFIHIDPFYGKFEKERKF